jgi:bifunctional UDP-N-acetylglucosamine pyrophosphorylase/glucosamine-1-phosphate N-acetyltransferase
MKSIAIVLAAGQGTRMRSESPKVLFSLAGRPMIYYALDAVREATTEPPVIVVGFGAEEVRQSVGETVRYAVQREQLGTGHAVRQAEHLLQDQADLIVVVNADMPLLRSETIQRLIHAQEAHSGPFTMLTVKTEKARGFGRIIRDATKGVAAIVEEAQATPEQLQINEVNVGAYCFHAAWLWQTLSRIPLSPKGEYYLTDLVEIAVTDGQQVQALLLDDPVEVIGINSRVHLAEAEAVLRWRINQSWMEAGVTLVDPNATYIDTGVTIGQDTVIWPNTYLRGETHVGTSCELGPNTIIRDSRLGDRCLVLASVMDGAILEDEVNMGPFARLRNGAHLARGVHMGNFGEVKNAYLGPETKMGHFSYVGDATIGAEVNIGAGTITCNYDGKNKHHTEIEKGVFIGSDTMLVAPITLGEGSQTGAGSVVTKDVPPHTLAVGMPARAIRKLNKGE